MRTGDIIIIRRKKCLWKQHCLCLLPAKLRKHQVVLLKAFSKPTLLRHHENSQPLAEKFANVQLHVKFIHTERLCV